MVALGYKVYAWLYMTKYKDLDVLVNKLVGHSPCVISVVVALSVNKRLLVV